MQVNATKMQLKCNLDNLQNSRNSLQLNETRTTCTAHPSQRNRTLFSHVWVLPASIDVLIVLYFVFLCFNFLRHLMKFVTGMDWKKIWEELHILQPCRKMPEDSKADAGKSRVWRGLERWPTASDWLQASEVNFAGQSSSWEEKDTGWQHCATKGAKSKSCRCSGAEGAKQRRANGRFRWC